MKSIGVVLALSLLGGCGNYNTLEELEQEAMLTGDWSRVEQRERILAKRSARLGISCPIGMTRYCENRGSGNRCACINSDDVQQLLMSWR
jgi:hypothetical protein